MNAGRRNATRGFPGCTINGMQENKKKHGWGKDSSLELIFMGVIIGAVVLWLLYRGIHEDELPWWLQIRPVGFFVIVIPIGLLFGLIGSIFQSGDQGRTG